MMDLAYWNYVGVVAMRDLGCLITTTRQWGFRGCGVSGVAGLLGIKAKGRLLLLIEKLNKGYVVIFDWKC